MSNRSKKAKPVVASMMKRAIRPLTRFEWIVLARPCCFFVGLGLCGETRRTAEPPTGLPGVYEDMAIQRFESADATSGRGSR